MSACGGSDNSGNTGESTANTESTEEDISVVVDPNAKSDSKGIGKFINVEFDATLDNDMATKGEAIFESKCTPCHKLTEEKLIGPGLKNITNLRTPEWIMNMRLVTQKRCLKKIQLLKLC